MAPIVEFEDKTVEKAIKKASEKLKIPARKLKHDVISYGSTGIFGLVGAKRAKIRVSVSEADLSTKQDEAMEMPPQAQPEAASLVAERVVRATDSPPRSRTLAVRMVNRIRGVMPPPVGRHLEHL